MAAESTKTSDLERLAELIHQRNENEIEVTRIIGRPAQIGHVGEYLASAIFNIALEVSATTAGRTIDVENEAGARRLATGIGPGLAGAHGVPVMGECSLLGDCGSARVGCGGRWGERGWSRPWTSTSARSASPGGERLTPASSRD